MLALTYTAGDSGPALSTTRPIPVPGPGEALIQVLRCGICATDLEIVKGYVPGYDDCVLGHEFVGVVKSAPGAPAWEGRRVVGEINCPAAAAAPPPPPPPPPGPSPPGADTAAALLAPAPDPAAATARNHASPRTVLGIISRDGAAAEWVALPLANLHAVPDSVSDARAVFVEPLAAACRVVEQGLVRPGQAVAVVGDGRLGLLLAAVLSCGVPALAGVALTHFGHNPAKLGLVKGRGGYTAVVVPRDEAGDNGGQAGAAAAAASEAVWAAHAAAFDVAVEATGSPSGAAAALRLLKPGGTLVLKTTCAPPEAVAGAGHAAASGGGGGGGAWAAFANDVVVQEKAVAGSRCGPFPPALALLAERPEDVGGLVDAMVTEVADLEDGVAAMARAARRGVVKVQLVTPAGRRGGGTGGGRGREAQ